MSSPHLDEFGLCEADTSRVWERDRGASLIEVVVSLSLLGFALVTLLGGLWSTVRVSVAAADRSHADQMLQTAVTTLEATPFVACATAYAIGPDATVTSISYWNGTTWTASCTGPSPQKITVSAGSRFLDVVKTND